MSNTIMDTRSFIPIGLLKHFHRDWTIKVLVLHGGSIEHYINSNDFEKIWKIIIMNDKVLSNLLMIWKIIIMNDKVSFTFYSIQIVLKIFLYPLMWNTNANCFIQ